MAPDAGSWSRLPAPEEFQERQAPWIVSEEIPSCPVCHGASHREFTVGFDYELMTCQNPWRFVQCCDCGHVWLNPRPSVSALATIYPPTYYSYQYAKINSIARKAKELLDRHKMSGILRCCVRSPRSYADIGCGDGRFLRVLERYGVQKSELYGLELDNDVVGRLRAEGYANVFCERVETSSSIPADSIDLLTMFHVIEHVADPRAVLQRAASLLSPRGVFALETPNLDSLDARLFQRSYWGGYHIPRHWNLFTPATMARLLRENGLEVIRFSYQSGHSFWMYSLHHIVRYRGASRPRLGAWFDPMKSLFGIASFTAVDLFRAAFGARTSGMLVICRRST